jgi:valyl-tRNA synthetase
VKQARAEIVKRLEEVGLLEKQIPHKTVLPLCYKCKTVLEPLPLEQWYIKVKPLIENALTAVDKGFTKIYPANFEHILKQWYAGLRDWNISRQNVWGIQIPVWYEVADPQSFAVSFIDDEKRHYSGNLAEFLEQGFTLSQIEKGLQKVMAPITAKVVFVEQREKGKQYLPETDTFDTWFSSGQWPYVTLKTSKQGDFEKFYPTAVMETGYDILKAWVSRMLMLGLYVANGKQVTEPEQIKKTVPFKDVVLHGLVNDPYGKKMSKSKGNVVNPLELVDQYGADAVRFALIYGTGLGNDQAMSYGKLDASKKFANKLWNMARFIEMKRVPHAKAQSIEVLKKMTLHENDSEWIKKTESLGEEVSKYLDNYQFNLAAERLYEFSWHEFADKYIEDVKNRMDEKASAVVSSLFAIQLRLLHPFMPFITEEIYKQLGYEGKPLIISQWPSAT